MKDLIICILVIITVTAITLLIRTWVEIHKITEGLKRISQENTNQKVKLSFSNRLFQRMAEQMNELLEQKKRSEIGYRNKDLQQRQEIANISHDLRTPLTSVIGYIQLLQDDNLSTELRKQYLDIVLMRSKALQTLIMDFFEFSRCESGEYSFDFQTVRLQDVLCEAVAAYYTDFSDRGIEPVIRIDEAIPCMIADENALKRIYQNLIQNTLKHGVGSVEIFLEYKDNIIISGFANDAPDLTTEDVEHLFERSFTADKMRSHGNTGFGLSIVKSLVEQMHGTISAELSGNKFSIIISWSNLSK